MLKKKRKLELVEQEGDGNCLFRAVSLQVYGDPSMHLEIRRKCLDFMVCFCVTSCYFMLFSRSVGRPFLLTHVNHM